MLLFNFQKHFRENLSDTKVIKGPLKRLKWSNWKLAVCGAHPRGYTKTEFKKSRSLPNACLRQQLFGNDRSTPCIYEIGVRFPQHRRRKIYVLHFKAILGTGFHVYNRAETLTIVRDHFVRNQIERLVKDSMKILIRRATGTKRSVRLATKYLHKFDYAWGWKRRDFRDVRKHDITLSTSWRKKVN